MSATPNPPPGRYDGPQEPWPWMRPPRSSQDADAAAQLPYHPPSRVRPVRRRGTGMIVAAVLAGVLGGVGGAAGYDALDRPDGLPVVDALADPAEPATDTGSAPGSVESVAAQVLPSVVKIDVASESGSGAGSGIILTSDGVILTNNHVVEVAADGGELAVSFNDGSTAQAEIMGTDPLTDLAVIRADGVSGLTPAQLGVSESVQVGQEVIAVGSPFGLESTVTGGIVSALDRPVSAGESGDGATVFPAIQTDAAINPGNSGGALVNTRGEVIGINTAIRSATRIGGQAGSIGLGFAIPIDEARPIAQQLRAGDPATHARLGVLVGTPSNEDGLPGGAEVRSVQSGTAGFEAGLEQGDVIVKVDGQIVSSSDGLVATIRSYRPGDEVVLTLVRDGAEEEVTVTLGSDADAPGP